MAELALRRSEAKQALRLHNVCSPAVKFSEEVCDVVSDRYWKHPDSLWSF